MCVIILFLIQTVGDAISDLLTVEVILMYKGVGEQLQLLYHSCR